MSDRQVKPKDILALLYRQGFRCAYTGDPLTPENTGADHIIPVSRGGGHELGNIALVLRSVNSAKGTTSLAEFVEMCRKVVRKFGPDGELAAQTAALVEELAGNPDACEVLIRLGYIAAAEGVREMRERLSRLEMRQRKQGGRALSAEEFAEDRRQEIAKLQQEIARLRVARAQLRAQTADHGAKERVEAA